MAPLTAKVKARIIWASTLFLMAAVTTLAAPRVATAEEYRLPDAIAAELDPALGRAWRLYNDRANRSYEKEPAAQAAALLRMRDENKETVSEDTFNASFAYRLLVAKMPSRYGKYPGEAPAGNVALRHFDTGVSYLYRQQNIPARLAFAKGIIAAAHLSKHDYNTLQRMDAGATFDKEATMEANALNLANILVEADLSKKEKILSVVFNKLRSVKADNAATDWLLPAYHLKAAFWNLGFFISAHWLAGNASTPDDQKVMQEALDMKSTVGWTYSTFRRKFKYHTADIDML